MKKLPSPKTLSLKRPSLCLGRGWGGVHSALSTRSKRLRNRQPRPSPKTPPSSPSSSTGRGWGGVNYLPLRRIRTRLLVAYLGILLFGFGALAIVVGQQISSAARADYEQRLQNEIRLIAQGISPYITEAGTEDEQLQTILAEYEDQLDGTLTIHGFDDYRRDDGPPDGDPPDATTTDGGPTDGEPFVRDTYRDMPEVETAMRGGVVVVERTDTAGVQRLYTASPITNTLRKPLTIQLSVPVANLSSLIWERWLSLALIFALVMLLALIAALWLAQSIIHPLYILRESAVQLSHGDLSHRVDYHGRDEIGEVAQAFNEMAQQVESMLEEQRAFASNTSHELRTPLTTIRLRTEALRYEQPPLETDIRERYITEIDDEVNRMTALIEDLTLLSRLDAGRAELGKNEIDFARLVSSVETRMLPQATTKNIRLVTVNALDNEMLPVQASLSHLTVVFRNVLDNAIKYTPDGGEVRWTVTKDGHQICSTIEDTGRGIHPDQLPHLFERFYRGDKARSRDVAGTGLGLSIVKSIVEAYGGTVAVSSEGDGKGTRVVIHWPLAD